MMAKFFPATIVAALLVITGWLVWGSINPQSLPAIGESTTTVATTTEAISEDPETSYECNGDGRVCQDGSIVGRTGPLCEFAACPKPEATSATIRTTIGQVMSGMNVSITPRDVIDDSRCPTDVQCIWAGTAHVKATVKTQAGSTDVTFELGHSETVGNYVITLTDLTPAKTSGEEIPDSSYRFVFKVQKA